MGLVGEAGAVVGSGGTRLPLVDEAGATQARRHAGVVGAARVEGEARRHGQVNWEEKQEED